VWRTCGTQYAEELEGIKITLKVLLVRVKEWSTNAHSIEQG